MNSQTEESTIDKKEESYSDSTKLLSFKTGGMRGLMKEGYDGINETTCNILGTVLSKYYSTIAIGYDHRRNSENFAQIVASIFIKHKKNITVFSQCTTPYLAFESLSVDVGLMITASHNSKEYNGFKVFIGGSQIVEPMDKKIEAEMRKLEITNISSVETYKTTKNKSILEHTRANWSIILSPINYSKYFESFGVKPCKSSNFVVRPIFSALHGVSGPFMEEACKYFGMDMDLTNNHNTPNSSFGDISHPNPEIATNYDSLLGDGENTTIFMCDPDGDRFGLAVCTEQNKRVYNGNEIAMIILFYILKNYQAEQVFLANTFLCSSFFSAVSKKLGISYVQTETGFKHLSEAVRHFVEKNKDTVVLAYEDPLGFLIHSGLEKDGIKTAVIIYFILQEYRLNDIFEDLLEYGVHSSYTVHVRVDNPKTALKILLSRLQHTSVSDRHIINTKEFQCIFRVSGTESLIKIYTMSECLTKETLVKEANDWISKNVYSVLNC